MAGIGDSLNEVQVGDPIQASQWNQMVRALKSLLSYGDDGDVMATGIGVFRRPRKSRGGGGSTIINVPSVGESSCTCGTCIDAGSVTDCASLTDDAPLNYRITLTDATLIAAFGTYVVLTYTGSASCTWESDTFNSIDLGDGSHNYTWKLVFAGEGVEEATLTLEDEL